MREYPGSMAAGALMPGRNGSGVLPVWLEIIGT